MGSRVELYKRIRDNERLLGLSGRALAKKYSVGRDTVAKALANAEPAPRKTPVRESPALGPFKGGVGRDAPLQLDGAAQATPHRSSGVGAFARGAWCHGVVSDGDGLLPASVARNPG